MIKVFQLDSYKIMPESPTFYGRNDKKLFDLDKHIDNYEHTATIDTNDLDEAFEIGNIGPIGKIERFSLKFHSLSVGDILELNKEKYIIASFGFDKLGV